MAHPMGESKRDGLRVDFDRRLKLEFHGSKITSDGGLLAYRELDDALGLTEVAGTIFQDSRTGKNGWHGMTGQFRQSVFARLGGYEDVNDADRLGRDPAMRWIVGGKAVERQAASTSQMGRFETELLATDANIEVRRAAKGMEFPWRCNVDTIAMDLKVSWEMSACSSWARAISFSRPASALFPDRLSAAPIKSFFSIPVRFNRAAIVKTRTGSSGTAIDSRAPISSPRRRISARCVVRIPISRPSGFNVIRAMRLWSRWRFSTESMRGQRAARLEASAITVSISRASEIISARAPCSSPRPGPVHPSGLERSQAPHSAGRCGAPSRPQPR